MKSKRFAGILAAIYTLTIFQPAPAADSTYDTLVYGSTMAGVTAAIECAKRGKTVILVEPGNHLGGMTTGGLGATDFGKPAAVQGIARDFYRRIYRYYLTPEVWSRESREEYAAKHKDAIFENYQMQFYFEPHVALKIAREMLAEANVQVIMNTRIRRPGGVLKEGQLIKGIDTESGKRFLARTFVDATYEGDLMAEARVTYFVGREGNSLFGESMNGIRTVTSTNAGRPSAYRVEGKPESGLLPGILPEAPGQEGAPDRRIQAYNYRVCLTNAPDNRVPLTRPANYDRERYELLARFLRWRPNQTLGQSLIKLTPMPNLKTDSNNHGPFSTDFVGENYDYPDAAYSVRDKIAANHRDYLLGFLWFLQNDEAVPGPVQTEMRNWGLPKDEFAESGNFPPQLYVREGRRLRGEYTVTESDCLGTTGVEDGVVYASYPLDSHQVSRYADQEGIVHLEGGFWKKVAPFPVSYRAMVPKRAECSNLLVPVCVSATHAAYGSLRMEPVFMALGQAAGAASVVSLQKGVPVQDVPASELPPLVPIPTKTERTPTATPEE